MRWTILSMMAIGVMSLALAQYQWRSVPIGGGGFVTGVVFHPGESDLIYARTDVGGAYRWSPERERWIPLNDDLGRDDAQLTGVVSLAVDANDVDRLYLACGQYLPSWGRTGAVLRSEDRGATWQRTELSIRLGGNADGRSTGERLQVDPHDGTVLWLGTHQNGLWRSTDRGVTWSRFETFAPDEVTLVAIDRRSGGTGTPAGTLWVGTAGDDAGLWRTTDGGASWTKLNGPSAGWIPHHVDFDYRDADGVKVYAAGGNHLGPNDVTWGEVWKFDADLATGTELNPPEGQGGYAGVSVDARQAGVVAVSTIDRWWPGDEVFCSTDGGATWAALLSDAHYTHEDGPWSLELTPHWTGDVDIDPHNSDRAIFVTGYGLWATENLSAHETGGQTTWTFLNAGLDETVPLGIVSPNVGAPLIAAYGDIGVFHHHSLSEPPGVEDRAKPHTGTATSIAFAAGNAGVMARTHHNNTRGSYTLDHGENWTDFGTAPPPASANGPGRITVTADGARFVWMPSSASAYYSADRGETWTPGAGSPTGSFKPEADRVSADHIYIHDRDSGRLTVSADGGASYTITATGLGSNGGEVKAVPGHEGHLWLPGGTGGLYRSINYGASLTTNVGWDAAWRLGVGKAMDGATYPAVYVWGRRGGVEGIWRSDDEGGSWVRINDDAHRFGWINDVSGDARAWGRVYLATGGRGVVMGEPAAALPPVGWTVFSAGQAEVAVLPNPGGAPGPWEIAGDLPGWATFDGQTGELSGISTDVPGTIHRVTVQPVDGGGGMIWNLGIAETGDDAGLFNLSARAAIAGESQAMIAGFVVVSPESQPVLVRGAGPSLVDFGISNFLAQPELTLRRGETQLERNVAWGDASSTVEDLERVMNRVGAFAWERGSRDTAILRDLASGVYTTGITGREDAAGIALAEVYDTNEAGGGALANLSVRTLVGTGNDILIGGLTIRGGGGLRLLVRAVGPSLVDFGVTGVLVDPQLRVFQEQIELGSNDNWSSRSDLAEQFAATASQVGAFALREGSADAVLLVELAAGGYTLQVSGADGGSGVALLELYVLP